MTAHAKSLPWQVVRQYTGAADQPVCSHRWAWVADLCASRRTRSRKHETDPGVRYLARRTSDPDRSGEIVSPPDTEAEVAARLRERPESLGVTSQLPDITEEVVQMQPLPCPDHAANELNCLPCSALRSAFYAALGRDA